LNVDVKGWRIGVPRRYVDTAPLEPETRAAFDATLDALAKLGIEIVDIQLRGLSEARAANFVALNAETYAKHSVSLREHPELYGPSSYKYHLQGAFLSATDYMNAKKMGAAVREIVETTLAEQNLRALATPTSPFISAERARKPGEHGKGVNACFTAPFNITGHPALSMPAGISESMGLPIGIQLVGALFDELSLLQIACAYEQATDWHNLHPDSFA
jgi:aspartyl-tRNA(Asn)/glutamyl-tRNA(Gln) amidotransferase subunit A